MKFLFLLKPREVLAYYGMLAIFVKPEDFKTTIFLLL